MSVNLGYQININMADDTTVVAEVMSSTSEEQEPSEDPSDVSAKTVYSKSETSETSSRPASPPPNCAICLGQCKNKSFTDSCLHQFCFKCLVKWSKVKPECPLCKQTFKSIIYNIKSSQLYDEYMVEPSNSPDPEYIPVENLLEMSYFDPPRFRYRTTLTLDRREGIALERLLMRLPNVPSFASASRNLPVMQPPHSIPTYQPIARRTRRHTCFRQSVYRHHLWANPLPDVTGRHRECSPEFYRNNPAQIHRLLPWLQRELSFLASGDDVVLTTVLDYLPQWPILSIDFRRVLYPFLGSLTDHFLHEFYCFASSPYDMIGYDQSVQYVPESSRPPFSYVNEVYNISADSDSDVEFVDPTALNLTVGSMRGEPSTSNGLNSISNSVIAIETLSHSDSEDSSDGVVMMGYVRPPHERTPEVVDLISDDDTMVVETVNQTVNSPIEVIDDLSTPVATTHSVGYALPSSLPPINLSVETPSTSGLVKIKLKRKHNGNFQNVFPDSESDDSQNNVEEEPSGVRIKRPRQKTKRRLRKSRFSSRDSASTEDTDRDTDVDDMEEEAASSNFKILQSSDDSDHSANDSTKLHSRKQKLACDILKKFKMSGSQHRESLESREGNAAISSSSSCIAPSTSNENAFGVFHPNRNKIHKKMRYKNYSNDDCRTLHSDNKKLKIKGKSKSKERLINKIFENQQVNDSSTKSVDKSKAKVKNKLFNKSFNKHVDSNLPSTSKSASTSHSSDVDESSNSPTSEKSLLDILSKSILKPNNSLLSINEHAQNASASVSKVPSGVKNLLDEINQSVFIHNTSSLGDTSPN